MISTGQDARPVMVTGPRPAHGPGPLRLFLAGRHGYVALEDRLARDAGPERGCCMPHDSLGLGVTLALACISASLFLVLRCEGKGRAFGPRSRRWAVSVIVLTSVLSTAGAYITVTAAHRLPAAFLGLGVLVPSSLWLGEIRQGSAEHRNAYRDASTLWVTRLLARMHEAMAEDREQWCEAHVDPHWEPDELLRAARHYHDILEGRLSPQWRKKARLRWLLHNIEARLDLARLIETGAARAKVSTALAASRLAQETRYRRSLDDLGRLAALLRHDAQRDVARMLAAAYNAGFHRLGRYSRSLAPIVAPGPRIGSPRPHP